MDSIRGLFVPFLLLWTLPTMVFYHFPTPGGIGIVGQNLILFIFVALYLLLASSLTYWTILTILAESRSGIFAACAGVALLFSALFGFTRVFGDFPVFTAALSTANLLLGAGIAGTLLSSAVKRIGELVPVCLTAAAADMMSVAMGPTKGMIEDISSYYQEGMAGPAPLVDFIVVKAGIPGFAIPVPLFGVTDWVLVALLSASLLRLAKSDNVLPGRGALGEYLFLPVSAVALFAGLVVAQLTGLFLPAMVFISLFFILYLVLQMKVHREMKKSDVAYSMLLPGSVVLLIVLISP